MQKRILQFSQYLYDGLQIAIYGAGLLLVVSFFFHDHFSWGRYGETAGKIAIILLWIIASAGILKRFRVTGILQLIQITIMRSRRRLGVLMFLTACIHFVWQRFFLYVDIGVFKNITILPPFELFGLLTLLLLLPLFVTSNNPAKRLLKENWQRIHYLIYPAMWLIILHVYLQKGELSIYVLGTVIVAVLQVLSRIYDWKYTLDQNAKVKMQNQVQN